MKKLITQTEFRRVAFNGNSSKLSSNLSRLPRAGVKGAGVQVPRDMCSIKWIGLTLVRQMARAARPFAT